MQLGVDETYMGVDGDPCHVCCFREFSLFGSILILVRAMTNMTGIKKLDGGSLYGMGWNYGGAVSK